MIDPRSRLSRRAARAAALVLVLAGVGAWQAREPARAQAPLIIRMATLVPDGSSWHLILKETAERQSSTASASPAHEKSLSARRSSGTATGFLVKKWTQPPSTQLSATKPFASRLASSLGRIFSCTQYTSSYESYMSGIPSA